MARHGHRWSPKDGRVDDNRNKIGVWMATWRMKGQEHSRSPDDDRSDEKERNRVGVRMTTGLLKGQEQSRSPDDGRSAERRGTE